MASPPKHAPSKSENAPSGRENSTDKHSQARPDSLGTSAQTPPGSAAVVMKEKAGPAPAQSAIAPKKTDAASPSDSPKIAIRQGASEKPSQKPRSEAAVGRKRTAARSLARSNSPGVSRGAPKGMLPKAGARAKTLKPGAALGEGALGNTKGKTMPAGVQSVSFDERAGVGKGTPREREVLPSEAARETVVVGKTTSEKILPVKAAQSPAKEKSLDAQSELSLQGMFANVGAVFESGVMVLDGAQNYHSQCLDFAFQTLEQGVEASASLLKCASPKDVMDMQQSFFQDGLDRWVQVSRDLSEISSATAENVFDPLSKELEKMVPHFTRTGHASRS